MKNHEEEIILIYGRIQELLKRAELSAEKKKEKETLAGRLLLIEGIRMLQGPELPFSREGIRELETMLERTPEGKPYFPGYEGLHFNISHSGEYAACALGRIPVGMDLQKIQPLRHHRLIQKVMKEEEINRILLAKDPRRVFAVIWTEKESFLKLKGSGIRGDIRHLPLETVVMDGFTLEEKYICRVCTNEKFRLKIFEESKRNP